MSNKQTGLITEKILGKAGEEGRESLCVALLEMFTVADWNSVM